MAGFIDALRALFTPPPAFEPFDPLDQVVFYGGEERGLTFEQLWGTGADTQHFGNAAGVKVDEETAMRSIVYHSGVRLLVNDIGSLPVDAFRKVNGNEVKELTAPAWVTEPNPLNPNDTWEDHVKQVVYAILTSGESFTRCYPSALRAEGVETLVPSDIDVEAFRGSALYHVKGESRPLTPAEIVHVPWFKKPGAVRGINPIQAAQEGLGIALAADQFVGSYFGNGAILSGWIKVPVGVDLDTEQLKQLKDGFKRQHVGKGKSHAVGALTGGAEFQPFDYNNRNAQLLELRDQIVEEVARLLGIPPFMLGSQKPGAVGYNSVEQRSIDYVVHAVLPIIDRIEKGYSRLLRGQRTYLRFNIEGLKRGDQAARAAYYKAMLEGKVIRRDEVRALEDLPFDPEGVGYLETPNNNKPEEPAPAQEPTDGD